MYRRVLVHLKPSQRGYVALAFDQQPKKETIDRSLKAFQHIVHGPSDTISEVGTGKFVLKKRDREYVF